MILWNPDLNSLPRSATLDQAGARAPRERARRPLAVHSAMTDRLAMSLHAASVRRGGTWVLRDISWRLRPGERWALLGDNGAGKTQLLKLLSGDVWPTPRGSAAPGDGRDYRVGRQPVELIDAKRRVAYVGAELQDK